MSLEANKDQENFSDGEAEVKPKKKLSGGAIAGIVIACVVVVGLAVGLSVGLTLKDNGKKPANAEPVYKSIAFLAAMEEELEALLDEMQKNGATVESAIVENVNVSSANYHGVMVYATRCGVGKVNAAYTAAVLLIKYHPEALINVGVAGGFSKAEEQLDVVISKNFTYSDADQVNLGLEYGQINDDEPRFFPGSEKLNNMIKETESEFHSIFEKEVPGTPRKKINFFYGTIGSGDQFIRTEEQVKTIQERFGDTIICVEMEGCAIAHVCNKFKTPVVGIRSLSDIAVADHDNTNDYQNALMDASKIAGLVALLLIKKIAGQ